MIIKKILKLGLIISLILMLPFISCEKEEEIKEISNKIEFTDFEVSEISYRTAKLSSKIPENYGLNIEEFGHCWSLDSVLDINDSISVFTEYSSNSFTTNLTNLESNSKYYVRAYFKFGDMISYSPEISFVTLEIKEPYVSTNGSTFLRANQVQSGGNVLNNKGGDIINRGVCWSLTNNPTIEDSVTVDGLGLGEFTSRIENLNFSTKYYLRAYATNVAGTGYGNEISFTTKDGIPELETSFESQLGTTTCTIGGRIFDDGDLDIIEKGVCWDKTGDPTVEDTFIIADTQEDIYTCELYNLEPATLYYYRAYIKNDAGTHYGAYASFNTLDGKIEIQTKDITGITMTSAVSGGEIIDDEGLEITEKGVCWNISGTPTINDSKTQEGSGNQAYESAINNLDLGTKYFVRAYIINEVGVSYGNEIEFITKDGSPILNTVALSEITYTSLKTGGKILSDEGAAILEKGICWNTMGSPVVADSKINEGTGSASFTSLIDNLTEGETYYFRAYAINAFGVGYGNELSVSLIDGFVSVMDFEGNLYNTVKIGYQLWLKENLKSTKYQNGDNIETTSSIDLDISAEINPKYQWAYNGEENNVAIYGRLYTRYVALDNRNVCPAGWHVPSESEFLQLIYYLIDNGFNFDNSTINKLGKSIASTAYWDSYPYVEGVPGNHPELNNTSGFTGLPSGVRVNFEDIFTGKGELTGWWSTSTNADGLGKAFGIQTFQVEAIVSTIGDINTGRSIRCIKD